MGLKARINRVIKKVIITLIILTILYFIVQKQANTKLMLLCDHVRLSRAAYQAERWITTKQEQESTCARQIANSLIWIRQSHRCLSIQPKKIYIMKKKINKGKDTILAIYFQKRNKKMVLKIQVFQVFNTAMGTWKLKTTCSRPIREGLSLLIISPTVFTL